jgi:hypothetical protein
MLLVDKLFLLLGGHFFGDFVLQNELMAQKKNPFKKCKGKGVMFMPPWYYWMIAHCFVHAMIVYFITQSLNFATAEFILHGLTDLLKCNKKINLHQDQIIHLICKCLYIILM